MQGRFLFMDFLNILIYFIFHNTVDNVLTVGGTVLLIWLVLFLAEVWIKWLQGDYDDHGFDASGGRFTWWR